MIDLTEQKITVTTKHGPFEVDAVRIGFFAVHPTVESYREQLSTMADKWTVTHVPSGLAATDERADRETAIGIAFMLGGTGIDWEQFPNVTAEEKRLASWIGHTNRVISATFTLERFIQAPAGI